MGVNVGDVRRRLKAAGYSPEKAPGERVFQVDALLTAIEHHGHVEYCGNLAGWQKGLYVINEKRVLVMESPKLIEPKEGDWDMVGAILNSMLGTMQLTYLFGWLKVAIESLRSRQWRPGQALVLCGPADCGKSLSQDLLTLLLGGRSAKPHRYMSDQTPFNGDLVGCEHLMIEGEEASSDIRARRFFGARIKEIAANQIQSCHAKYRPAISLPPFWRLSISVNDEPENLLILPPLDESLVDKFIMLKCAKHPMPMRTVSNAERVAFMHRLKSELPALIDFLLKWRIPADLESQRYGITHYHHPAVTETLTTLAPEFRLLELIDAELWAATAPAQWQGSATELERKLTSQNSNVAKQAERLLGHSSQACGNYLARLCKKFSVRVNVKHTRSGNLWTIQPPQIEDQNA
jgi:hypothetical protein